MRDDGEGERQRTEQYARERKRECVCVCVCVCVCSGKERGRNERRYDDVGHVREMRQCKREHGRGETQRLRRCMERGDVVSEAAMRRGGGLGSRPIFEKFNEPCAPS